MTFLWVEIVRHFCHLAWRPWVSCCGGWRFVGHMHITFHWLCCPSMHAQMIGCRLNRRAEKESMERKEIGCWRENDGSLGVRCIWIYRAFVPSVGTMIDAALWVMNDVRLLWWVHHRLHGSSAFGDGHGRDDFAPCRTLEVALR